MPILVDLTASADGPMLLGGVRFELALPVRLLGQEHLVADGRRTPSTTSPGFVTASRILAVRCPRLSGKEVGRPPKGAVGLSE
ncbi:hypothetical protein ACFY0G_10430 [Streptomyces sp. NPDC001552]|uniref:hypothetical protein n=1 Tax=unclassified Streptomyces TaxID=2593676 RepID=UPI0036A1B451